MVQKSQTITCKEWDQRPTSTGEFTGFLVAINSMKRQVIKQLLWFRLRDILHWPRTSATKFPTQKAWLYGPFGSGFYWLHKKKWPEPIWKQETSDPGKCVSMCFIGFSFAKGNVPMTTYNLWSNGIYFGSTPIARMLGSVNKGFTFRDSWLPVKMVSLSVIPGGDEESTSRVGWVDPPCSQPERNPTWAEKKFWSHAAAWCRHITGDV